MITFVVALALTIGIAVVIAYGCGHYGSTNIVDRDAQRQQAELTTAMVGRLSHHR
jgi:hypothetical protein